MGECRWERGNMLQGFTGFKGNDTLIMMFYRPDNQANSDRQQPFGEHTKDVEVIVWTTTYEGAETLDDDKDGGGGIRMTNLRGDVCFACCHSFRVAWFAEVLASLRKIVICMFKGRAA